ncbi:hypothetical protein AAG570_010736 [Ranatra chinensis]|uniref:Uncharacterized protein n=1 Tax=Ranatra chinensis TaxID=642074 RepID=A0ABD0YQK7_9HEMI
MFRLIGIFSGVSSTTDTNYDPKPVRAKKFRARDDIPRIIWQLVAGSSFRKRWRKTGRGHLGPHSNPKVPKKKYCEDPEEKNEKELEGIEPTRKKRSPYPSAKDIIISSIGGAGVTGGSMGLEGLANGKGDVAD